MPVSVNVKLYFKGIICDFLGIIIAALGTAFVGFFGDYFNVNPLYVTVGLSASLGIDVFGALVPIIIGLVCMVLFFRSAIFPIKKLAVASLVSVVLGFLFCRVTDDGVAGYPFLFTLVVSTLAVAVNAVPKPFIDLRKKFIASLMLTLACVPLSLFAVDLFYSSHFSDVVIGGNGLSDGLLISILYAPFGAIMVFSVLAYLSQTVWFVRKSRVTSTITSPAGINPVICQSSE